MERGEVLAGRYELVKRLGRGGMGEVWAARDRVLHRDVALKLLGIEGVHPDLPQRFVREAVAAAQINHPNVVALYDRGVEEDALFLVMEKVEGATLSEHLHAESPMPLARALEITEGICAALVAAHQAQVIHYDIKPHNVMLTADGQVKVVDFGIAGFVHTAFSVARSSQLAPAGTPEYGAPEQFLTERGDERSDLYALGGVLFALLAGRPPFTGHNGLAVMRRKLDEEAPRLDSLRSDLPPDITEFVAGLLQRDPDRRPQSARSVQDRLRQLRAGPADSPPPQRRQPPNRPSRSVRISHSRAALRWRKAGETLPLAGSVLALAGALAGLLLDGHLHQGHHPVWGAFLAGGAFAGWIAGSLVSGALGLVRGTSLTSDSVTFDREAITVTESSTDRRARIRWDDLSLIALIGPADGRKDLVAWFRGTEEARSGHLHRLEGLDNDKGHAYRLYRTASGLSRPQQLRPDQLSDVLREYAADLHYEVPSRPMSNLVAVGGRNILAVDRSGNLWRYAAPNYYGTEKSRVGTGWSVMRKLVAIGDSTGDILAIDNSGNMYRYHGPNYHGSQRTRVGTGWDVMTQVSGTGDGTGDVFAVDGSGRLFRYRGPHYYGSQRKQIGTGWNVMSTIVGVGDISGSGSADILAVDGSGRLFHYYGPHYYGSQRKQIGTRWNTRTNLVAIPGAGTTDLLATNEAGEKMYSYTGPTYSGSTATQVGVDW